jgi:hypothetical protein
MNIHPTIRAINAHLWTNEIERMRIGDIKKLEETLHHWHSVVESILRDKRKAAKEEEPE